MSPKLERRLCPEEKRKTIMIRSSVTIDAVSCPSINDRQKLVYVRQHGRALPSQWTIIVNSHQYLVVL